jgi:hypothetical protein
MLGEHPLDPLFKKVAYLIVAGDFWRILRRNYSSWWSRSSLRSPVWMFFEA